MTFPSITIASYDLAEGLLGSRVGSQFTHVVSINDPDRAPPGPLLHHEGAHLVLSFHDISDPDPRLVGMAAPKSQDVECIIEFAAGIHEGSEVLCHCAAGISRSSAAALTILASKLEPSSISAMKAVQEVLRIKDMIHPNGLMVGFADRLLGYKGRLVDAYSATFKGGSLLWMPSELEDLEPE